MVNQARGPDALDAYRRNSREFLSKGEGALDEGDLLQASEKFWGASAHMVKAVATRKGWEHSNHGHLFQAVNRLASETQNDELRSLFLTAGQLHTNFYENWLPHEMVRAGGERVKLLLERLERAL